MASRIVTIGRTLLSQPNFGGLLGSTVALGMAFSFVSPFLSTWGTEAVGMTPTQFSLFMTMTSLCAMAVNIGLGRLSDTTFSRRRVLIAGGIGGTLGFAGYAVLRDPLILVACGCTMQAMSSSCFSQLFSHTREEYQRMKPLGELSTFPISVIRVGFSLAWTVGPAVGAVLLASQGFTGLFFGASGLYLLFLLGILRFVPERKRVPRPAGGPPRPSVWKTMRHPNILLCVVGFAAIFAGHTINMMNLPLALIKILGGSEKDFGIVFGIGPIVEIPLMLWFGQLAGRGFQMRLIQAGFVFTFLYFLGLGFATEPWHVYLLQILSGASWAVISNVAIVFFQDLLPGEMGLATALFANSQSMGALVGMLSFGIFVESVGYRGCFFVCASLAALAMLVILFYRGGRVAIAKPEAA